MAFSVNTNVGAMAALQSLNATNRGMATTQSRINTGLNVASTKDDSAKYVIAQTLRGDLGKLSAVTSSLTNAKSVTDTAVAGAEQISDILNQMKSKALEASDVGLDVESRTAISKDLLALKKQVNTIISGSDFNGTNLLTNTPAVAGPPAIPAKADKVSALQSIAAGAGTLDVANQDFTAKATAGFGGAGGTAAEDKVITDLADAVSATGATAAKTLGGTLDTFFKAVKTSLSELGSASRQIDGQLSFNSKLTDVVTAGIGNLVDADLAKESAKLQALQVQQQLGVQALGIANQAPQTILSLFR